MYISPDFYWGYASVEGHRPSNEDMHIVQDLAGMRADLTFPLIFAGLYDGHGGTSASSFCREKLHLQLCRLRSFPARIPYALRTAFLYTDKLFIRRDGMEDIMSTSGTTSCVCLQQGSTLFFANAGDSRAIIGVDPASPLVHGENSRYAEELSAIVRMHQSKNANSPTAMAAAAALEAEDKRRRSTRGLSISSAPALTPSEAHNILNNEPNSSAAAQQGQNGSRGGSDSEDSVPVFTLTNLHASSASLNGDQSSLVSSSYVFRVSRDHKPSLVDEKSRIEQSGSYVTMEEDGTSRVAGILSVSRAIGDGPLKKFGLISTPELAAVAVGDVTFIVLACDGLWDVMNEAQVAACVRRVVYAAVLAARVDLTAKNLTPDEQEVLTFATELESIAKNDPEDVIEDFRFDDDEDISMEEVEALVAKLEDMAKKTKAHLEHIKDVDTRIAEKVVRVSENENSEDAEGEIDGTGIISAEAIEQAENASNSLTNNVMPNNNENTSTIINGNSSPNGSVNNASESAGLVENNNNTENDAENISDNAQQGGMHGSNADAEVDADGDPDVDGDAETEIEAEISNPNRFSPDTIAKYLVRMALSLGTTDNVTVIVGVAKNIMPKAVRRSLERLSK